MREPLGGSCEKCNIYKIIPYIPAGIFKGCLKNNIERDYDDDQENTAHEDKARL